MNECKYIVIALCYYFMIIVIKVAHSESYVYIFNNNSWPDE